MTTPNRTIMQRAVPACLLLVTLSSIGCGPENNFDPMTSPSGKWVVIPSIVRGKVLLSIQNADGTALAKIQTKAPDSMMWAGGWMNEQVFVLDSAKVGTLAWNIDKDGKFTSTPATMPMRGAGERFFAEKHPFEF